MVKTLGAMVDCSRNGVMTVESIKRYAKTIRAMGYNALMLYTEDTYELEGYPYFGIYRGRYSKDELKEVDKYCNEIGIELIPCIQTLGHLEKMLQWSSVYEDIHDCANILLVGEEKTYQLIDTMLKTVSECFTTRRVHLGMDETASLGTGKYKAKNGPDTVLNILTKHLDRVSKMAKDYGLEPMIWGDMFYEEVARIEKDHSPEETKEIVSKIKLPEGVKLIYWDYGATDQEFHDDNLRRSKMFTDKVGFAGPAITWHGIGPDNAYSMRVIEKAFDACMQAGVEDIFLTSWGDDGAECSHFAVMPTLMYAAEYINGNKDIDSIRKKFKDIIGCDFEDFMLVDYVNNQVGQDIIRDGKPIEIDLLYIRHLRGKYIFYGDMFCPKKGSLHGVSDGEFYGELAKKLDGIEGKGEYAKMFDVYVAFCRVLEIKAGITEEIRAAYDKKDMEKLKELIAKCEELEDRMRKFHSIYQSWWFAERKPHGFDLQDHRVGGLTQRIVSCTDRLKKYVNGEIPNIPELDEPMVEALQGMRFYRNVVSVNNTGMN